MLILDKEEFIEFTDRIFICIGTPAIFKGQFSISRYGEEARLKLYEYGKSLIGIKVSYNNKLYEVGGSSVMLGSCGYVGSLLLEVTEVESVLDSSR